MTVNKFTRTVLEYAQGIPSRALERVLRQKISASWQGVPDELIDALSRHIMSGNREAFTWGFPDGEERPPLNLSITDDDCAEIEAEIERVTSALPDVVVGAAEAASKKLFQVLRNRWDREYATQQAELADFRGRLEERWGDGFAYLRMLLTCCRDIGRSTVARFNKSKASSRKYRRWVMVRLHIRACQVSDEIICLMENGFADGAMARWRTLHELCIVAMLVEKGDEELAERYMLHDAVEVKRQADEHDATNALLGGPPVGRRERAGIEREYAAVIARFGPTFVYPYGWAASYLRQKKPTFKDLQEAADRVGMNNYYKLASFNVHASARSLFFNLSSMGMQDVWLAGRSNAGLADPGQQTAHSLLLITNLLLEKSNNLDEMVNAQCCIIIRDKAIRSFSQTNNALHREEGERQKALASRRARRRKTAKK